MAYISQNIADLLRIQSHDLELHILKQSFKMYVSHGPNGTDVANARGADQASRLQDHAGDSPYNGGTCTASAPRDPNPIGVADKFREQ